MFKDIFEEYFLTVNYFVEVWSSFSATFCHEQSVYVHFPNYLLVTDRLFYLEHVSADEKNLRAEEKILEKGKNSADLFWPRETIHQVYRCSLHVNSCHQADSNPHTEKKHSLNTPTHKYYSKCSSEGLSKGWEAVRSRSKCGCFGGGSKTDFRWLLILTTQSCSAPHHLTPITVKHDDELMRRTLQRDAGNLLWS